MRCKAQSVKSKQEVVDYQLKRVDCRSLGLKSRLYKNSWSPKRHSPATAWEWRWCTGCSTSARSTPANCSMRLGAGLAHETHTECPSRTVEGLGSEPKETGRSSRYYGGLMPGAAKVGIGVTSSECKDPRRAGPESPLYF